MTLSSLRNKEKPELTAAESKRIKGYYNSAFRDLMLGALCALFGYIYEHYSHGVFSYKMMYAFMIPVVFGAVPFLIMHRVSFRFGPGAVSSSVYHAGLATLTVGCIVQGVLEIYGTSNHLVPIYYSAGFVLAGTGLVLWPMIIAFRNLQGRGYR